MDKEAVDEIIFTKHGFATTKKRSTLMKRIKSKDTRLEVEFRRRFWRKGYRYRVNDNRLPGKPDIVFWRQKVVVFVDGEFWHGYKWHEKKQKIKSNREYWIPKIEANMERDNKNTSLLKQMGWSVFRFWEHEVKEQPEQCLFLVVSKLGENKEE